MFSPAPDLSAAWGLPSCYQHINARLKDLGHGRAMSERGAAAPGSNVVLLWKQQLDMGPSDAVWLG